VRPQPHDPDGQIQDGRRVVMGTSPTTRTRTQRDPPVSSSARASVMRLAMSGRWANNSTSENLRCGVERLAAGRRRQKSMEKCEWRGRCAS